MKIDQIVRDLIKSIQEPQKKGTSPYDSKGVVTRVEDGTAWVKLAGSSIETPVQLTVSAEQGDNVQVRVGSGTAWLTGNGTEPPTGDKLARRSYTTAKDADKKALAAQNTAAEAYQQAEDAAGAAEIATNAASVASEAARGALRSLAEVEDVVGTLEWFAEHITATTDTVVDSSKIYYSYSDGKYTVVEDPEGNPSAQGWYEIDEAITNYIATHLSLVTTGSKPGLYLIMDNSAYQLRLFSAGVEVLNSLLESVAKFGELVRVGIETKTRFEIAADSMIGYNENGARIMDITLTEGNKMEYTEEETGVSDSSSEIDIESAVIPESGTMTVTFDFVEGHEYAYGGIEYPQSADVEFSYTLEGGSAYLSRDFYIQTAGGLKRVGTVRLNIGEGMSGSETSNIQAVWGIDTQVVYKYNVRLRYTRSVRNYSAFKFGMHPTDRKTGDHAFIAGGEGNIAGSDNQLVAGKYNDPDFTGNYSFMIGNGTDEWSRSNSYAITSDGHPEGATFVSVPDLTADLTSGAGLTSSDSDEEWLYALTCLLASLYRDRKKTVFEGVLCPNSQGFYRIYIYDCSKVSESTQPYNQMPQYAHGEFIKWANNITRLSVNNYSFSARSTTW